MKKPNQFEISDSDQFLRDSVERLQRDEEARMEHLEDAYKKALEAFSESDRYRKCASLIKWLKFMQSIQTMWIIVSVILLILDVTVASNAMRISTFEMTLLIVLSVVVIIPFFVWTFWAKKRCENGAQRILYQWVSSHYLDLITFDSVPIDASVLYQIMMRD